jgi:chromosome partitioning protein
MSQISARSLHPAVIPRNTDLRDAHFQKQDVFTSNSKSAAAQAYDKLIRELFDL